MAVPTLSNVPTSIDPADSSGAWSGRSLGVDPDIKVEGLNSVTANLDAENDQLTYNSASFSRTGQHFRGWIQHTALTELNYIEFLISDGANTAYWEIFRGASYNGTVNPPQYRGGWFYTLIDMDSTPDTGTLPTGTITQVGWRYNRVANPRNVTNTYVDALYYGAGYTATGGTSGDPITFTTIYEAEVSSAYGVIQNIRDVSFLFGEITVGSGTTPTYMTVANEAVIFADAPVSATLYGIVATGSGCTFDSTNNLFKSNGTTNFAFDMSAVGTLVCDGNVFIQASPLTFGSGQTITSNTFINCGGTTTNGATIVRGSFENCSPVVVSDLSQLSLCTFMRDDAQSIHAVELTSLGTGTMTWTCIADDGYNAGSAGTFTTANDAGLDASIFVNVGSGNLTINVGPGGTIPSIRTAGATVTVQQAVTLSITNVIEGSELRIYDTSLNELGGGVEQVGISTPGSGFSVTAEGGGRYTVEYSYNYSVDTDVIIVAFDVDYVPLRLTDTLGNTSRSIKIEQQFDRNYDEGATPFVNP